MIVRVTQQAAAAADLSPGVFPGQVYLLHMPSGLEDLASCKQSLGIPGCNVWCCVHCPWLMWQEEGSVEEETA